jgi:hypothetical protein
MFKIITKAFNVAYMAGGIIFLSFVMIAPFRLINMDFAKIQAQIDHDGKYGLLTQEEKEKLKEKESESESEIKQRLRK